MSRGYNIFTGLGRLTRDPDVKTGASGTSYLRFSLACGYTRKNRNGEYEDAVDYIPCVAFGRTAEVLGEHCSKGRLILVSGKVQTSRRESQDGKAVYDTSILVNEVTFCEKNTKDERTNMSAASTRPANSTHQQRKADGYAPEPEQLGLDFRSPQEYGAGNDVFVPF